MTRRYRLADGVVLSLGTRKTSLIDIAQQRSERLTDTAIEADLERAALGEATLTPALTELAEQGYLEATPLGADPHLRARLARLDASFRDTYASTLSARAEAAYQAVLTAHAFRKRWQGRVGQAPVLPETALRRALSVGEAGGRRVLCFGDDDLVSIALAALGHEVCVLDIDDYLLRLIELASASLGLGITTRAYDASAPLPQDLGLFDAFVTDPMSNRACFELFLSRALALVRPGGEGFVAVFAPAGRIFSEVAARMGLDVQRVFRKHNKYYSASLELDFYESDWVKVGVRAPRLVYAPDAEAHPQDLYRDDITSRPPTLLAAYADIETRFALPGYVDVMLDVLEREGLLVLQERHWELGETVSIVHGPTNDGAFVMHIDRRNRVVRLSLRPFRKEVEARLRQLCLASFKRQFRQAHVEAGRAIWDLRVL